MENKLITRKDIARMTGLSVRTVLRREKSMGVFSARVSVGTRSVYYNSELAIRELKLRGYCL